MIDSNGLLGNKVVAVVLVVAVTALAIGIVRPFGYGQDQPPGFEPLTVAEILDEISLVRSEYFVSGREDPSQWLEYGSELSKALRRGEADPAIAGPALRDIVVMLADVDLDGVKADHYLRIRFAFDECTREHSKYCWWYPEDAIQYR